MIASLVGCIMGSLFGYLQPYFLLGSQELFGAYLMLTSIVSAMILTLNLNERGKIRI
jgi:hypothetical protein